MEGEKARPLAHPPWEKWRQRSAQTGQADTAPTEQVKPLRASPAFNQTAHLDAELLHHLFNHFGGFPLAPAPAQQEGEATKKGEEEFIHSVP